MKGIEKIEKLMIEGMNQRMKEIKRRWGCRRNKGKKDTKNHTKIIVESVPPITVIAFYFFLFFFLTSTTRIHHWQRRAFLFFPASLYFFLLYLFFSVSCCCKKVSRPLPSFIIYFYFYSSFGSALWSGL